MISLAALALVLTAAQPARAQPPADVSTPEGLAVALSEILQDAIPRSYEKKKDWDSKKRITIGMRTGDDLFDIHRRKKLVNHGVWKYYRVRMIDPEEHLDFRIENLRNISPGRIGFTCYFTAKLDGWAQARLYNRGVHLGTFTAQGDTTLQLWLDCELGLQVTSADVLAGIAIEPVVNSARLELDDFRLKRVSKAHGPMVEQLGKGLRLLVEHELDGPKLTAKLNRAIEKKRDRLRYSADRILTQDD